MDETLLALVVAAPTLVALAAVVQLRRLDARYRSEAATSATLRAEVAELHRANLWTQEILERMSEGVLVLDKELHPTVTNAAARDLLGLQESPVSRVPSEEVLRVAGGALADSTSQQKIATVWFPRRMNLWVRAASLPDGSGVVVVLQDISEELRVHRMRRDFVAHASHELKTPVAGIQALAEAVREAVPDDPGSAERFAMNLVHESERLSRLIGDLLDLSRLEEPQLEPGTDVALSDVAKRESARIQPSAGPAGINFSSRIAPDVWVHGDDSQLGVLIRNLLENAFRYTPAGGSVTLELSERDGEALVRVTDTGIGIPLEEQARVFERFYRVDRARSRDRGGTGLGLAIVKHVAELHGGTVLLESELGRGSTFIARIPVAPDAREARQDVPAERPSLARERAVLQHAGPPTARRSPDPA